MLLEVSKTCWTISADQYVNSEVTNVEKSLDRGGRRMTSIWVTTLSIKYCPWLEESPQLRVNGVQSFQELIGQIIWAVVIGRIEILFETSLNWICLAIPRIGHPEKALQIFGYLKLHPKRKLGFELAHPYINENRFQGCDWAEFYQDSSKSIPGNNPVNRGNCMSTN